MNEKCKQHCGWGKVLDRRIGSVRRRSTKVQLRKIGWVQKCIQWRSLLRLVLKMRARCQKFGKAKKCRGGVRNNFIRNRQGDGMCGIFLYGLKIAQVMTVWNEDSVCGVRAEKSLVVTVCRMGDAECWGSLWKVNWKDLGGSSPYIFCKNSKYSWRNWGKQRKFSEKTTSFLNKNLNLNLSNKLRE